GDDGGGGEENGHEGSDDRAEREEEHEQRHRDGELLRPLEVVVVASRGDAFDGGRQARRGAACPLHRALERCDLERLGDDAADERGVPVVRDLRGDRAPECALHERRYACDRGTKRRIGGVLSITVEVGVLVLGKVDVVVVVQGGGWGGVAEWCVLQLLGACDAEGSDGSGDERQPDCKCKPRVARAPASDSGEWASATFSSCRDHASAS